MAEIQSQAAGAISGPMQHDFDIEREWCKRCGRSGLDLRTRNQLDACDGDPSLIHPGYLQARRDYLPTERLIDEIKARLGLT